MAPSHVLVPLDGSPLADAALDHALETFDNRLTVLNVITPLDTRMSEGGIIGTDKQRHRAAQERAEELVAGASRRAESRDRVIETAVESGNPADVIIDYIDANDVDHVVMGSNHGERGVLSQHLLGTVATHVVSEAPITVTVVR